jgi:hypothetical protein
MRKTVIQLLLFVSVATYGQTVDDIFRSMPTSLLPGVSEANRTMLLSTENAVVSYSLGEITKLQHTDNFLEIRTSAIGTMQIKLLPAANNSTIICVIRTVCGRACDSHIAFYTTDWEKLETAMFLPTISAKKFLDSSQKDSENYKYALSLSDISPISAQFNENSTDIVLTFNYKQHLSADVIVELRPFLRSDTVVLSWRNGSFR